MSTAAAPPDSTRPSTEHTGDLCNGGRYLITPNMLQTWDKDGNTLAMIDGPDIRGAERDGLVVNVRIHGRDPLCLESPTFDDAHQIDDALESIIAQHSIVGRSSRGVRWVIEHWKLLSGAVGLPVLLFGVLSAIPGPWVHPDPPPTITSIPQQSEPVCMGATLTTLRWDFKVDDVAWRQAISSPAGDLVPDGKYLLVFLALTNRGERSHLQETNPDPFELFDGQDTRFRLERSSSQPGMSATEYAIRMFDRHRYYEEVDEGGTLNTVLAFDIDPGPIDSDLSGFRLQPDRSNGWIKLDCRA